VGADLRLDIIINEHLARGVGRGFDPAQGQFSIGRLCGAETGVFWAILALFRPVGAVQAGWRRAGRVVPETLSRAAGRSSMPACLLHEASEPAGLCA
jgi:hypothetical protein